MKLGVVSGFPDTESLFLPQLGLVFPVPSALHSEHFQIPVHVIVERQKCSVCLLVKIYLVFQLTCLRENVQFFSPRTSHDRGKFFVLDSQYHVEVVR